MIYLNGKELRWTTGDWINSLHFFVCTSSLIWSSFPCTLIYSFRHWGDRYKKRASSYLFLSFSLPLSLPFSLSLFLYLFLSAVLNAFWGFVAKKWRQLMSYKFVKKRNMLKIVFRFLVFLILEKDTAIFSFTLKGFILWWPSRYEFGLCYLEAIKGWSTLRTADLVTCLESAVVKKKYFPFSNSNVSPYKRPKGVLA